MGLLERELNREKGLIELYGTLVTLDLLFNILSLVDLTATAKSFSILLISLKIRRYITMVKMKRISVDPLRII